MSGYAPLRNGNGEFLVGLDMRADELGRKLSAARTAGGVSLASSVLLALLFSRVLSAKVTKPVRMLIARCRAIAKGDPDQRVQIRSGDELEELVDAFNAMSQELTGEPRPGRGGAAGPGARPGPSGAAGGRVIAEVLREGIAAQAHTIGEETIRVTLSLGVAGYRADQSLNDCIKEADTALYRAKVQGRNRVVAASPPGADGASAAE